ncbi:TetR/AcrR family transcriptional regulator [Blastococcus saxobsidens]|uniref:TetR/AcrR family transcriptional regulator n=1 Tax=Blastococcus saxobsidens TaxID=138336 RepID=A0A6L9W604_9ACTN|nr:TetR/AcrR family transcriptional regulator [Blastococcus saxobsidens]NEK86834.1 TetR/AcrR family transcriptional regulator [Blastococcus saxobsidens]
MPATDQEQIPVTERGRRTRAALLQAGRELFEERGFADVRIDSVVERAGVSHGTFYTWFDSKESLLRAIVAAVVDDVFTATTVGSRLPPDAPYARIEAANRLYLTAFTRHARILRVLDSLADTREEFRRLRVDVREAFVRRGTEGLERLQELGLADRDLPPRATVSALGAMVESFAQLWQDPAEGLDEDAAVEILTRLWAGAIGLPRSAWESYRPV